MRNSVSFLIFFIAGVATQDCRIVVPKNPLSIAGLATPYRLLAPCNQSDTTMSTFVQGVIVDTAKSALFVYNPLVINDGTTHVVPILPPAPATFVSALWFGTNAATLTLIDDGTGSLIAGNCVNGLGNSIFGQFAYCNAPKFFTVVDGLIKKGLIVVPPLGMANDGLPCPTIRDFFVVDMDQSDNVLTSYLSANKMIYQDTAANRLALSGENTQVLSNGSDNVLLSVYLTAALGCAPWTVPDLADPGRSLPALPLNEIQAKYFQAEPVGLVPITHPMTRVNGQPSLEKVNIYRQGVFQPASKSVANADAFTYCSNLYHIAPKRLALNSKLFRTFMSPQPQVATNLFSFMAQRFASSFGPDGLNCLAVLQVQPPVVVIKDGNGIAIDATVTYTDPKYVNILAATVTPTSAPADTPVNPNAIPTIVVVVVFCVVVIVVGTIVAFKWDAIREYIKQRFGK